LFEGFVVGEVVEHADTTTAASASSMQVLALEDRTSLDTVRRISAPSVHTTKTIKPTISSLAVISLFIGTNVSIFEDSYKNTLFKKTRLDVSLSTLISIEPLGTRNNSSDSGRPSSCEILLVIRKPSC
jgi:hypothetical protein